MSGKKGLIRFFAGHKVAANLVMVLMLLAGIVALQKLNVQFFPSYEVDVVTVRVPWSGASAEDVETAITVPLEQRLRDVEGAHTINSVSTTGAAVIYIEFDNGTDKLLALDRVKTEVDSYSNLPSQSEAPTVSMAGHFETIAKILITGLDDRTELRQYARLFEQQLLERGVDLITFSGLPDEKISIEVSQQQLLSLGMTINQLASQLRDNSQDSPLGVVGESEGGRELRAVNQRRTLDEFAAIDLSQSATKQQKLGDVAAISYQNRSDEPYLSQDGKAAIVLNLKRGADGDSIESAEVLEQWRQDVLPTLPKNLEVEVFNERWTSIRDRIQLLIKNGGSGLVLVLLILYLFLSGRVALWVAVGIPVSFMATLAVLYLTGGSINMITLFALIMALGIIVDDAIVVAEDAQSHYEMGEGALEASSGGAWRMLAPVLASSMTTVAAFLPLMLVSGRIGSIMFSIPLVVICVILASLVESFLVLPGHLRHAFKRMRTARRSRLRGRLEKGFAYARDDVFKPLVTKAIAYRELTVAIAFAWLIIGFALLLTGQMRWHFFPAPESTSVSANVRFMAGTSSHKVDAFLQHVEQQLDNLEQELDENAVVTHYVAHRVTSGRGSSGRGSRVGSIYVELSAPDSRIIGNQEFVKRWQKKIQIPDGVESFTMASRRSGPYARDIDLQLSGAGPESMKQAALELVDALNQQPGVLLAEDNLNYGREQLLFELRPQALALGLTVNDVSAQVRAAYQGSVVQYFQQAADEIIVQVELPKTQRDALASLSELPILVAPDTFLALNTLVEWQPKRGFEVLNHEQGALTVTVSANVDNSETTAQAVQQALEAEFLPNLAARYGLSYEFAGSAENQRQTFSDLKLGGLIGLALMYIILTAVFSSYGWPLMVMSIIPFGVAGAFFGHWLTGIDLTLLSVFGMFGLSGIVINDSIILVGFYKQLLDKGMAVNEALVEAATLRFRAVILTSLTTVAGLMPLLFETSRQAQFLIPMATSLAFGLAFATFLILVLLPAFLSFYESARARLARLFARAL